MNSFNPTIKFLFQYNKNIITFLDLNIYKGPNFSTANILDIETDIKPTNRQACIHATSYHPSGIYVLYKAKYWLNLQKRGYSPGFTRKYTNSVKFTDQSFELKPKIKHHNNKIEFSTRYTPLALKAFHIIKKYWPFIHRLKGFKNKTIPRPPLAYKSNKNLESFLVRAKLPSLYHDS